MLSKSPDDITLGDIINGGKGQGTESSFRGVLKSSLAVIGAQASLQIPIDDEIDMYNTGAFSGDLTDTQKLLLDLLPCSGEVAISETGVARTVGGALREFFTNDSVVMSRLVK